jgi:hypothetical protein
MPGATGGIRAGRAFVELALRDNQLVRGLRAAEARLKGLGSAVQGIGARLAGVGVAIGTPFIAAAKSFADVGSELADMSARTGVSVERLSELGHAATQTGATLGDIETGIRKTQKAVIDAATGNEQAAVTFGALGLSIERLTKLSPDQQFTAVAEAIGRIQNPTAKAAAAMEVFGKSGTSLVPLIDNMDTLTKEARDLGLVMSTQDAEAADALGDAMDLVSKSVKQVAIGVGAALAPVLTDVATTITSLVKSVLDWVNANRPLLATIFQVTAGIVAGGVAFVALGAAISGVGVVLGGLAAGIGLVGTVLGALLTPIGLITAGLAAGAVAFFRYTEAGRQSLGFLGQAFGSLRETATTAFKGIGDALKAGDIRLAGEILWAALRVQWLKGVQFLKETWADLGTATIDVFRGVVFRVASLMTDLWAGLQVGFVQTVDFLRDAWTSYISFLQQTWNNFGGFFAKVWARIKALFTGGDIEAEIARINAETAAANAAVQAGADTTIGGREQARTASLAGIEAERQGAQAALASQQDAEIEARRQAAAEGLAAGAAELAKAQEDLKALTSKAAGEAAAVATPVAAGKAGEEPFTPDGLDGALRKSERKVEAKGTFSAAALRGLGLGDSMEKLQGDAVKEQKKANDKLDKINRSVKEQRQVLAT